MSFRQFEVKLAVTVTCVLAIVQVAQIHVTAPVSCSPGGLALPVVSPQPAAGAHGRETEGRTVPHALRAGNSTLRNHTAAFGGATHVTRVTNKCSHAWNLPNQGVSMVYCGDKAKFSKTVNCSTSLQVLEWITSEANKLNITMMITYGTLIHVFREGALMKEDGKPFDDDFDFWTPPDSLQHFLDSESTMFNIFGWSSRILVRRGKTVFSQFFPACNHRFKNPTFKLQAHVLEFYPLMPSKNSTVTDMWNPYSFSQDLVLPAQVLSVHPFESSFPRNTTTTMQSISLQVPRDPARLLTCLYGNWEVYSAQNAHVQNRRKCLV
eukprot:CAMPEP_0174940164 /NCGR_PEP_ID=MMETSP1355-20121228/68399_1 /TAXON_ID=464990 /ORGANISM="Hemiselmis tepida, Strain CCMP443" /LENGTH=321 /DNA_ID=CAMNT_0016187211 /DNA_START=118 /DNA_END=1083 /DNA_ORIENTATION=+